MAFMSTGLRFMDKTSQKHQLVAETRCGAICRKFPDYDFAHFRPFILWDDLCRDSLIHWDTFRLSNVTKLRNALIISDKTHHCIASHIYIPCNYTSANTNEA